MSCRKQNYLEVEKIRYKALKIVYNSNECYEELLIRNNEVSIHQKQLRTLATEIYKSLTDVNPDFMKSYFPIKEIPYSLRNGSVLKIPPTRSTYCGTNSIHFRACLLWNKLTYLLHDLTNVRCFPCPRVALLHWHVHFGSWNGLPYTMPFYFEPMMHLNL